MRRFGAFAGLICLALAASACASLVREGDRRFAAGRYEEAASLYEQALAQGAGGRQPDRIWFLLGLVYSLPIDALRDPERAADRWHILTSVYPQSPYALPAQVILERDREVAQREAELTAVREELSRQNEELAALARKVDEVAPPAATEEKQPRDERLVARINALQGQVARLTQELEAKGAEIERLKKALAALKQIDLGKKPHG